MKKDKLIESFFLQKENTFSEGLLEELVRKQFNKLQESDRGGNQVFKLNSLPDIQVDEIYWGNIGNTSGDIDISTLNPQRGMLYLFLKNINGTTPDEKLNDINSFYSIKNTEDLINRLEQSGMSGYYNTTGKKISLVVSYLVFIKTLTKILSQVNASSVGFTFEAFLAILLKGKQIASNSRLVDVEAPGEKDTTFISCKMLKKGGGTTGSVNNLINELKDGKTIFYLIGEKDLVGDANKSGQIIFYKFPLTLDNLYEILEKSGSDSTKQSFRLPKKVQATAQVQQPQSITTEAVQEQPPAGEVQINLDDFEEFNKSKEIFNNLKSNKEKTDILSKSFGAVTKASFYLNKDKMGGIVQEVATISIGEEQIVNLINRFKDEVYEETLHAVSNLHNANILFNNYISSGLEDDAKAKDCINRIRQSETSVSKIRRRTVR